MASDFLYILNAATKCITQVNADSAGAKRARADAAKKVFTSMAKAQEARRKLK